MTKEEVREEITFEMRQLHDRILVCAGCHKILLASPRGWRCDTPGHQTGFDSDEMAATYLQRKTGLSMIGCMRIVKRYRAYFGGMTREERTEIFRTTGE